MMLHFGFGLWVLYVYYWRGRVSKKDLNVLIPARLTAENGAKFTLSGEFFIDVEHICTACCFHGADEDCEFCGGNIYVTQKASIPWTTIKDIHKEVVKHFTGN